MALAHTKIYSFRHEDINTWDHSTASNGIDGARANLIALRNMFVGLGWKVASSHDGGGNFGNNDDVDHWTSPTALTRTGSNRIWIVFQAPVALGSFQIMFYTGFSAGVSWLSRLTCLGSVGGGFGVSGGGTDGTTTAQPTATDQNTAFTNEAIAETDGDVPGMEYTWHAAESTDGEHLVIFQTGGYEVSFFFCCQKVANADANLTNGVTWIARIENTAFSQYDPLQSSMDNATHYIGSIWRGQISGANATFFLGTRGYNNTGLHSKFRTLADKKMILTPCDIYEDVLANQGYYGTLIDVYYGNDSHFLTLLGDTVGGAANWFSGGSLVIPWDSAEPNVRRK